MEKGNKKIKKTATSLIKQGKQDDAAKEAVKLLTDKVIPLDKATKINKIRYASLQEARQAIKDL